MSHPAIPAALAVVEATRGNSDQFAITLRQQAIPHLSYSQITAVEFCPRRYLLQYLQPQPVLPQPEYFGKGKLLHEIIAHTYQQVSRGEPYPAGADLEPLTDHLQGDAQIHLRNAIQVHMEHYWREVEVLAVEEPFVLVIDPQLPPLVGVIDLLLRQGDTILIIDHKTGRDFTPQDGLQMAIYAEWVRRQYSPPAIRCYYDHYRWVNHLQRIRKPAFQRDPMPLSAGGWPAILPRIQQANTAIQRIRATGWAPRTGPCFRCPCRPMC